MSNQCELAIASVGHRCFRILGKHMKSFVLIMIPLSVYCSAHAQVHSGTVFFVDFSQNEITIAADSRITDSTGKQLDTECKVSAFGNQFVFVMAGISSNPGLWNAHDIARESWKTESKAGQSAQETASAVSQHWLTKVEEKYNDPEIIKEAREYNPSGEPALANAVFAAIDQSGGIALISANILYDRNLYDSTRQIRIWDTPPKIYKAPRSVYGGLSQIAQEFVAMKTQRSKSYMSWFLPRIANQGFSQQRAAIATKLVELSILLHPKNSSLDFPIDVLQLDTSKGVRWIEKKDKCPAN